MDRIHCDSAPNGVLPQSKWRICSACTSTEGDGETRCMTCVAPFGACSSAAKNNAPGKGTKVHEHVGWQGFRVHGNSLKIMTYLNASTTL